MKKTLILKHAMQHPLCSRSFLTQAVKWDLSEFKSSLSTGKISLKIQINVSFFWVKSDQGGILMQFD
jgi:hypothetical protein